MFGIHGPQKEDDHLNKFREYRPSLDDSFHKPENVGRKPGHHRRQRNPLPPKLIVDRIEIPQVSTNNEQTRDISFAYPLASRKKEFELHLGNTLSKPISKCQGRCVRQY